MFQCVQRWSQITARAVELVARAFETKFKVFAGEVAVAACTSATLVAFWMTNVVRVDEYTTEPTRLLPLFAKPAIV
jgi:hypothetical protein